MSRNRLIENLEIANLHLCNVRMYLMSQEDNSVAEMIRSEVDYIRDKLEEYIRVVKNDYIQTEEEKMG